MREESTGAGAARRIVGKRGFTPLRVWTWMIVLCCACGVVHAAKLSDPEVDAYKVRVGTETFAGLYHFTTNTLLVETAQAITNLGSDTIKFYLGPNTSGQSGAPRPASVTNLMLLARDEPSYRKVFDMPFRHFIVWSYPISNPDAPFLDGTYSTAEQANDYRELYDLTRYFLTNYSGSGKTFYLGHWEGDGYLSVNNWTTNPSPAVINAMIAWLNNRQKAVDDAKHDTVATNVHVFHYTEANRVRDAMLNGPGNNQRLINDVVPYVTNLDYLSYSSYDVQDLSAADLYATLDYMQAHLPTNKAASVSGARIWIGEYGHGDWTTDAQEPFNRAYIQRLLNWNYLGSVMPFILYWEIYNNEVNRRFCLIDSNNVKTASWRLENYFLNDARMAVARFRERQGRVPTDLEFVSLVSPLLNQPLPSPIGLAVTNLGAVVLTNGSAIVTGSLAQGVYGDNQAGVWVYYGRGDGGTSPNAWENSAFVGTNTNFNSSAFSAEIDNLAPNTNYFYRFCATNGVIESWAPTSSQLSTTALSGQDGARLKISPAGDNRGGTLNMPGACVSWPGSNYGFALYSNTNLAVPVWKLVTNQPILTNDQWQVAFPVQSPIQFYRLQSQ